MESLDALNILPRFSIDLNTIYASFAFTLAIFDAAPPFAEISSIAGRTLQKENANCQSYLITEKTQQIRWCHFGVSLIYLHFPSGLYHQEGFSYSFFMFGGGGSYKG